VTTTRGLAIAPLVAAARDARPVIPTRIGRVDSLRSESLSTGVELGL